MKLEKSVIKKRILPTLLISAILPTIIYLSVPFEIFANNYKEFTFSLSDFLPLALAFFLLATAVFFFALLFLPKTLYRLACAFLISLSFMFFIQGTYLNGSLNTLQGDAIDNCDVERTDKIVNILIWVFVIVVALLLTFLFRNKKAGIISTIGIVVSCMVLATQVMIPLSLIITDSKVFMSYAERSSVDGNVTEPKIITNKNLNNVSTDGNIFVFCLDRFDERFAEQAYTDDNTIYDNLTGFTWFQNHLSSYRYTYPAIANLLTNRLSNPSTLRVEDLKNMYSENNTLCVLNDNNYKVNVYSEEFHAFGNMNNLPNYINNLETRVKSKATSPMGLLYSIVAVGLYRTFPFFIKDYIHTDSAVVNSFVKGISADNYESYFTTLGNIDEQFIEPELNKITGKQFTFIHTEGFHDLETGTAYKSREYAVNNFRVVNRYINFLKQQGLYENSTIIITGDHGINTGGTALFVKPKGANSDPLKTSQAQTSHANLWATIMKSEGVVTTEDYGRSVFEITEDETVERTYYMRNFTNGKERLWEMVYKVNGNVTDDSAWQLISETTYDKTPTD